ncbi:MAG: DNA-(apurinic or apyrimidinic site) lyase [Saprospiraceae bacterium]|nr:DNA-(apurinic or apyrimidinic site) lyase [Saprospiraceae bacterium]
MPELPEVNTVMKGFRKTALHLSIRNVIVHDDKILRNATATEFYDKLIGRSFVDTYRRGKYFFALLDDSAAVLFHLGMTGDLVYYFNGEDRPKYERFNLHFEGGLMLGYDDLRKFSKILLLDDYREFLEDIKLGPDALQISFGAFSKAFSATTRNVKSILMDQHLMAGIGNLYADEICFQARIHPASIGKALSTTDLHKLHQATLNILKEACRRDAYYKVYPEDWFWKWRDDKIKILDGKGNIGKMKIGGRTTYYVEDYQKLIT